MPQRDKEWLMRNKIYFILGAIVVVVFLITLKVLVPQVTGIPDKHRQLAENRDKLAKLIAKRKSLEAVQTDNSLAYLQEARIALPDDKAAVTVISQIENLSSASQLGIDGIDFNPGLVSTESAKTGSSATDTCNGGAPCMTVDINGRGKLKEALDFINLSANSRRLAEISEFSLKFDSSEVDFVTANFSFNLYYLPPPKQIGGIDKELPQITEVEKKTLSQLAGLPDLTVLTQTASRSGVTPVGKSNLFKL